MVSELWFSRQRQRLLAAAVEDGRIVELHPEPANGAMRGAVYLARVQRIVPNLGAAFVQLAPGSEGYLEFPRDELSRIAPGQEVTVQVRREAHADKRARVTRDVELAGRALSLRPAGSGAAVSRRIEEPDERRRLRRWAAGAGPGRLVLRSAAAGLDERALDDERLQLVARARKVALAARAGRAPLLLEPAAPLQRRLVLDFAGRGLRRVLVESERDAQLVGDAVGPATAVERHRGKRSMGVDRGILETARAALQPRVELEGGGALTIEPTRALWAIDVDSASAGADARAVNLRAARRAAREIRLRDAAGTIVVDFLGSGNAADRAALEACFREALRPDRRYLRLTGWTPLGLCEIARRRDGPSLAERLASIGLG